MRSFSAAALLLCLVREGASFLPAPRPFARGLALAATSQPAAGVAVSRRAAVGAALAAFGAAAAAPAAFARAPLKADEIARLQKGYDGLEYVSRVPPPLHSFCPPHPPSALLLTPMSCGGYAQILACELRQGDHKV